MKFTDDKGNQKLLNLHSGHRNRLRANLVDNEWENVEEYKLLEYILGLAIPRKETNELAHTLIDEFGSLAGVLDAGIEDLKAIKGVGEISATFLHSIPNIFKAYKKSKLKERPDLSAPQKVMKYIGTTFNHMPMEEVYMACVDANSKLIACKKLAQGSNNEVAFTLKSITETAVRTKADGVILLHNHPNGNSLPSSQDIEITRQIFYNLLLNNVFLLDHLIISKYDGEYYSFKEHDFIQTFKDDFEKLIGKKNYLLNKQPKYELE